MSRLNGHMVQKDEGCFGNQCFLDCLRCFALLYLRNVQLGLQSDIFTMLGNSK